MRKRAKYSARLLCGTAMAVVAMASTPAMARADARAINIEPQPLASALREFASQSQQAIMVAPALADNKSSLGVQGATDAEAALAELLKGTGLTWRRSGEALLIVSADQSPQSGSAAGGGAEVEALIVTAQKREEDIQDVPIAISAFTQEDLTRSQVAGGPDLMTQIPNMTFTKTNFSSYSIQIRGIGTQAISATTDAAVAVAFNNTPFIRNRFFEQEFYDLARVEVLRGPQGTLYGRNATAGVVNIISAKPKFGYEARLSADVANYSSTRLEGMVNLPLVDDVAALRLAGAWTKREGFVTNEITGAPIDGRDLWSTRLSLRIAPTDTLDVNLIWEHFEEDDDRLRSGKQLCHQDDRTEIAGLEVPPINGYSALFSQGCLPASLYSPDSYEAPNGLSLPYYLPLEAIFLPVKPGFNPYASLVQSPDLRVIESTVDPEYRAKSDLFELQFSADLSDSLTLASETSYSADFIYSTQDFNRFNTARGAFADTFSSSGEPREGVLTPGPFGGIFCDPQVGCADRVVAVDLSTAQSRQFSQELRLSSDYDGPFNFSLGANFLRYDTEDKYYVFINTLTLYAATAPYRGRMGLSAMEGMPPWVAGISDNSECMLEGLRPADPRALNNIIGCLYVDPNPISSVNDMGHNYFLSRNPYKLISYAAFGEAYYNILDNLKVTAGLRWTVDKKEAPRIPSWVLAAGTAGHQVADVVEQEWRKPTGRLTIDWKPELPFTDETMIYGSYAHGYKAGGANPPPAGVVTYFDEAVSAVTIANQITKPRTFDPEFVDAFEVGAKNTFLGGGLTLNLAAFYYDYENYQLSQIIDRSAVNYNFDTEVWGLELEADWRPLENLRLGLKGGYEKTRVGDGSRAIDIMDRTAGNEDWVVVRPFPTQTSNCVIPAYVLDRDGVMSPGPNAYVSGNPGPCEFAYIYGYDPVTWSPYVPNPTVSPGGTAIPPGYIGWDPTVDYGNNNGEGFYKDLSGNELPNAPHFTATITADYTLPLPSDWLMTLHTDLYYQSEAWTRIFNTEGYDKLKAYTNVNLAAIFTNEDAGWKVMAYVKNVFDRDSITGAFLNSDDTGLTTNVFLTEPRLYGLRITKEWSGGPWWTGANPNHTGPYPLTVEIGGQVQRHDAPYSVLVPEFADAFSPGLNTIGAAQNRDLDRGDGREVKLTYRPTGSSWAVSAGVRYGRTNGGGARLRAEEDGTLVCGFPDKYANFCDPDLYSNYAEIFRRAPMNWSDTAASNREEHQIVDFEVGRDIGVGRVGLKSVFALGIRYAEFESRTMAEMDGIADYVLPEAWKYFPVINSNPALIHFDHYRWSADAVREFKGGGPMLSWDGAQALLGDEVTGLVAVDAAVSAGILFGKQETNITGSDASFYWTGDYRENPRGPSPSDQPVPISTSRSTSVTVPVLDLSLGLSYEVGRVRLGAGYRWERYFDVLDVGTDEASQADRTIDGPYFKLAVGFGG